MELKSITFPGMDDPYLVAPGGYGLGTTSPKSISGVDALDAATANGWYYVTGLGGVSYDGVVVHQGLVFVLSKDAYHAKQYLYPAETNTVLCRTMSAKVWGNWVNTSPSAFAPSGYGLGNETVKELTSADDINNIRENGWYAWTSSKPQNAPINYSIMRVWGGVQSGTGNYYCVQELYTGNQNYANVIMRRTGGTNWQEWAFENPPMLLGVEYLTTERWNGKAVYTKLLDFGALPNATAKEVSAGGKFDYVSIEGIITNGTNSYALPHINNLGLQARLCVGGMGVQIHTLTDMTAYTALVHIKYTKD